MACKGAAFLLHCSALFSCTQASLPPSAGSAELREEPPSSASLLRRRGRASHLLGQETGRGGARSNETQWARHSSKLPKIYINLDLPPRDRFREWAQQFAQRMAQPVGEEAVDVFGAWIDMVMSTAEKEEWLAVLKQVVRAELLEEVEGIAEEFQKFMKATSRSSVPFPSTVDGIILISVIYELDYPYLACSGLVVARPDGTVIHGRNLDYVLVGYQRPLDTIEEVVYMRDGKPLYTALSLAGTPNIAHTAMRFGGWVLEQNTHFGDDRVLNLEVAKAGGIPSSWGMRHVLETAPDFPTAVATITRTKFMAPQYFILSGAGRNEGAVITLHRGDEELSTTEPNYPAPLQLTRELAPEVGVWYLAQTNDEVWGAPHDVRRPFEQEHLETLGREGINEASIMQLLRTPPAFQLDLYPLLWNRINVTLFTAVFNAAEGTMQVLRGNESYQG